MTQATQLRRVLEATRAFPRITDVLPAAYSALGLDIARPELADTLELDQPRNVCVVLIDGLGYRLLSERLGHAPCLRRHYGDIVEAHTVIPSTTAAAITSFTTGEFPGRTRMVGWSVKDGNEPVVLLSFDGSSMPPEQWQPVPTLFQRAAESADLSAAVVLSARFANSGLTRAALRGATHVAAESWDERIDAALHQLRIGTPMVYLYWSELDHTGHVNGWESTAWVEELERIDAGLARLEAESPRGSVVIVTADHGMVDTHPSRRIDIADHPELHHGLEMVAGEGRAVHIHPQPGADDLLDRWERFLADRAIIVRGHDIVETVGGKGAALMGAGLALMCDNWVCVDSRSQPHGLINLIGVHGATSAEEMTIPVLRLR
ncbi:MAG: alkaline phosphatase family protein [Actinomycetaceae bacterium]|nr:alkaline phosphatase family protein [Actinomycetaceae bacterium]